MIFLQSLDLQECTAPHFKNLIHICLEPEAQGCGMTFNRFYVESKYPYFIPYRGRLLYFFSAAITVSLQFLGITMSLESVFWTQITKNMTPEDIMEDTFSKY